MSAIPSTSTSTSTATASASLTAYPLFLRRMLWLDAATGAAIGALQLLLNGWLASFLGLPETLLVVSGWVMFAYVAGIGFIATRPFVPAPLVRLLIGANFLWVLGCLALLLGDWVMPTLAGKVFIAIQAVTVGLLAELQWVGLRKAAPQTGW